MTPDIEKRLAEFGLKPTPLAFRYGPFQETANFYHEAEVLKLLKTLDTYRKGCAEAREALELCELTSGFKDPAKFERCMVMIHSTSKKALSQLP